MESPTQYKVMATPETPHFSIVVPCYNEMDSICEFHKRLIATIEKLNYRFEVIYVNDGSTDKTFDLLVDFQRDNPQLVTVIDLVQNVGQTNALTAGVQYAAGKHIIFLDCDLQVAPEDMPALLDVFNDSYDMIGGARHQRKDNILRIQLSRMGNAAIRRILGLPLFDFGSGMKILNGSFVRAFEPGPFHPINPGAMMLSLRRVAEVPIRHFERTSGKTRWTLRRFIALYHNIFKHLIPFIYPFTILPFLLLSFLLFVYYGLSCFFPATFPSSSNNAVLPMLLSLNIALSFFHFLLLGEYVMRGNNQVQEPAYIIRRIFSAKDKNASQN